MSLCRQTAGLKDDNNRAAFLSWLACWLLLPNLPFLAITVMGGPPRYPEIVICAGAGLIVRTLPYGVRLATFVAMLNLMTISFVARMFNMNITMVLSVAHMATEINLAGSPEYVLGALLFFLTVAWACFLLRKRSDFSGNGRVAGAIAAILLVAAGDYAWSREAMGSYSRYAPTDARFTSATAEANLVGLADGKTNLLLVVVEAMGEPRDPALRTRFDKIWMRPELAARYEITRGSTRFFGSTTSGEIRELCGHWGDYREIHAAQSGCLPAMLKRHGYTTTAIHAFHSSFFERDRWYPMVGFQRSIFGKQLLKSGAHLCRSVFYGPCDREVPGLIAQHFQSSRGPQFVYWLTLNSHLPIVENTDLRTESCLRLGGGMDHEYPMVCRLFAVWEDTADALIQTINRPDFPPTHVLIVGDHMPPLTRQQSRLLFHAERVPWILLRSRVTAG